MNKLTLIVELPDGTQQTLVLSKLQILAALNGVVYTLVEQDTQRVPEELVLKRKGDDLYIEVDGVPIAQIDGFYSAEMNAIFSADGTLTPGYGMAVTSSDVLEGSLVNDNGEATVVWAAQESGLSPLVWTGGILAGGIVAAVALSGGGGGTETIAPKDSSADAVVVNAIANDNVVNSGEATEGFNITGSGETGATVNLTFESAIILAAGNTAIVDGDGNWTVAVTSTDIAAMGEGAELISVTQTDIAGNMSAPSVKTIDIDTTAPTARSMAASPMVARDDQGSVQGDLTSGDSTDDTTLILSGSNEAGSRVNVYNGSTLLGAATISGTTWRYSATIVDGTSYQFNAQETDAAGNESAVTSNFAVTGDTTAPTASSMAASPMVVSDDQGSVQGDFTDGDSTDDTALILSGSNEAGSRVNVYNGSTLLGAATISGTTWSYSATVTDGTSYQFNTKETDAAGNESVATSNFAVTGDTTAPTASSMVASDDQGSVQGDLSDGDSTDDTMLVLSGSNEAGSRVNVYSGSTLLGAATISGTTWSYSATVTDGTSYQFNAQETDAAGNESVVTSNFAVTGDTTAPTASSMAESPMVVSDNQGSVTGDLTSGDSTDDTALVLSGSNEAGSSINVYNGGVLLGAATISGTTWRYSATVTDGTAYQFNTQETDAAGNESPATSNFSVTGDMTAPTASSMAASPMVVSDDQGSVQGDLTSGDSTDDTALILSGSNEAGSSVNVYNGSTLLGAATISGTTWSYSATVTDGTSYQFNTKETDAAGNESVATSNFAVTGDTTAPTASSMVASDDQGSVQGDLSDGDSTDDTTLILSGSNEAGSRVNVYNGSTLLGAATVTGTGWIYNAHVADGTTYQFNTQETDVAGNESPATSDFAVTGDTTAPTASSMAASPMVVSDDQGSVQGDLTSGDSTDDTTLILSGSNEAGSKVNVYSGSTLLGAATISGTTWRYSATIVDGTSYQFNAQETDAAGNESVVTSNFAVTGDTTAPTASSMAESPMVVSDNQGSVTGDLTSGDSTDDTALVLSGSNEAGSSINVYNGGVLLGAATISGTTWRYSATVTDGTAYQFNTQETDAAGNESPATSNFSVTGDMTAPTASSMAASPMVVSDDQGSVQGDLTSGDSTDDTALILSGSNEAGSSVNVYNGSTLLGAATISGTTWSYSATVTDGTSYQFNTKETDAAGNESVATSNFAVTGDTTAPTASSMVASDDQGSVQGDLSDGDSTDDTTLILSGSNEAGSRVNVYNGSTLLGAATVTGTGWIYNAHVADGTTYQFNTQETDVAGNESPATSDFAVTGDTTAPTASSMAASPMVVSDDQGSVQGDLTSGDSTDDTTLILSGSNEAGSKVNVYSGSTLLGAATISGTTWRYSATVTDGTAYQFNTQETDAAGNESPATSNFSVTGDTTAPTASSMAASPMVVSDNQGSVTGDLASGDSTDDTALVLSGSNEAGSKVNVYSGNTLLGAATISGTTWRYSATVADGTAYQFNTQETDAAGNESPATSNFSVTGDTTAPTASSMAASPMVISDNQGSVTGDLTSGDSTDDTALVLSGSNEAGSSINVYNGGVLLGAATISGTTWRYSATVTDGTAYQFNTQETDAAGNESPATSNFSVTGDTTAPTVAITDNTVDTATGEVIYTFTFPEAVNDFTVADVTVTGGSKVGSFDSGVDGDSVYTLVVTPDANSITDMTVNVAADIAKDTAGNNNLVATESVQAVDTVIPTVAISDNTTGTAIGEVIYTFNFSEAMSGFTIDDVILTGGAKGTFTEVSASQYTLVVTPDANSITDMTVNVAADIAKDPAGNNNLVATESVQAVDTVIPTVAISDNTTGTAIGEVIYTFNFSEAMSGFTIDDVILTGGAKGTFTEVSASEYTLVVTPDANSITDMTVNVAADIAKDTAGNNNLVATESVQAVDTVIPTVTISDNTTGTAIGEVIYTFNFSEAMSGFTANDVTLTGGTKGTFTEVSVSQYTLVVTPDANSITDMTVNVAADIAKDPAGNNNLVATESVQAVDTVIPTVTISDNTTGTAIGEVIYTFNFSEAMSGFTANDVTLTGGTKGTFTEVSASQYTLVVTPDANSITDMTVNVAADIAKDPAGNNNLVATESVQVLDTVIPTVTISDNTTGTAIGEVIYTFNFSEAMSGFTANDVTLTGGTKGTFTEVSASQYTLVVTPDANSITDMTVNVAADIAKDPAGNNNLVATESVQVLDTVIPTVTISDNTTGTAIGEVIYTFNFSEAMSGFTANDVTLTGGTKGTFTEVSASQYTLVVTPDANSITDMTVNVAADIAKDPAGNNNLVATESVQAVDTVIPTVAISDNTTGTAIGEVIYTFNFSEAMSGFTIDDVILTGGTKGTFTEVSASQYTLVVTPSANSITDMTVNVAADIAKDTAGNNNLVATESVQAVDTVIPTVTISDNTTGTAIGEVIYTFNFSEAMSGFTIDDVTLTGGTKGTFTEVSASQYTLVVTPDANSITDMTVNVAADIAKDPAGNNNLVATESVQAVDTVIPTVTISDNTTGTAIGEVIYSFNFSEAMSGFTANDVILMGGTKGTFTEVSASQYTLVVTPDANSTTNMTVNVAADIAKDTAGNNNLVATESVQAVDTVIPTVTISDNTTGTAIGEVIYTFNFSEAMSGFTIDDVTLTGGAKGTFTEVSASQYTLVVTPDANSITDMTVNVAADIAKDPAGNNNLVATESVQAVDTVIPTVAISDNTTGTAIGEVIYTFNFSEAMSGFTIDDVILTGGTKGTFTEVSASQYTLVVTPDANSITEMTVNVAADIAKDTAGNNSLVATESVQAVDTVIPTVTISDNTTGTAIGEVIYTFNFSEAMSGFTIDDVILTGGTKGTFTEVSASQYTLVVTPDANSITDMTVNVAADIAKDPAGNNNLVATESVQVLDTVIPTVTISDNTTGTAIGEVIYTFNFSEAMSGFTANDVTLTGGTKGTFTEVSASQYTLVVTPDANSTTNMTVNVAADIAKDTAGNNNLVATESVQAVDTVIPTVTISDNTTGTAIGEVTYTFNFSEAMSGFTANDVTLTGGTKGTFTEVSASQYTLVVTPDANSTTNMTVNVAADIAKDTAGNNNLVATESVQAVDTVIPTVTITDNTTGTAIGEVIYTFNFSEAMSGFTANDVTLTGGTKGTFTEVSASQYTLVVTPDANSTTNMTVNVAADIAKDTAGNNNLVATESVQAVDTVIPTVTITDNTTGTAIGEVIYSFNFSEAMSGFTANDVILMGGTKGTFTEVSASQYTLVVTPDANSITDMTVNVAADIAKDPAGNNNLAATESVQAVDTVIPTVTISDNTTGTAIGEVIYSFNFSEAMSGFAIDDVILTGGTKGTFTEISASQYTLVVTPDANSITDMTVNVATDIAKDPAGNNNLAATESVQAVDTVIPTVTISDNTTGTAIGEVIYSFNFSEAMSGFAIDDVILTGGTKGTFTEISASQYTLVVTPDANSITDMTVNVAADIAKDTAGNNNLVATESVQAVDTVIPTVAISDNTTGTAIGEVIYTFNFSEAMSGFTANDVTLTGGTKGTFTEVSASQYTLVVTPDANSTTNMTVNVAADIAKDTAGNNNLVATESVQAVDTVIPTVTISDNTTGTAIGEVTYTFNFSEAMSGFTANDVTLTGGTKGTFTEVSASQYTLVVTPDANSTTNMTVNVAADIAKDTAGNNNLVATESVQAVDTVIPTVTITDNTTGTAIGEVIYSFNFSEAMSGFTANDVILTGGTKGTFTEISASQYTLVVTPDANSTTNMTVNVAADIAKDTAGNNNLVATESVQAVDTVIPTVAISDNTTGTAIGEVIYTFNFSEAMSGFTANDVILTGGTKGTFTEISASQYTLVVTPDANSTTNMTVNVAADIAKDTAGNNNLVATESVQAVDTVIPTVAISDNTTGTAIGEVIYTFNFSEAMSGFTANDVILMGGTKGTFTEVSASQYTLVVTPSANSITDMTVNVAADIAKDTAGNNNLVATESVQAVDTVIPTVAISDNTTGTAIGEVIYTFNFSEAMSGFTIDDVTLTGGAKGTFTEVSASQYTLVVTPSANSITDMTVNVAADIAKDTAGNNNLVATESVQAVDTVIPTVAISDNTTGTAIGEVIYTFNFSEAMSGFTANDVTLIGGTKGTFTEVSASQYTLVVTPDANSITDMTVNVAADIAKDTAGNNNLAATESVQAVDTEVPTTTITGAVYNEANNTLVLTGTNITTLLSGAEDVNTDLKANLNWSKLHWDMDNDNNDTNNVPFTVDDIKSAVATNNSTFTITLNDSKAAALEGDVNLLANGGSDNLDIATGFVGDTAGNIATTDDYNGEINDASVVVFDLVNGVSSSHSGRIFDANIDYTVYILVDSANLEFKTVSDESWGRWTAANNLDASDQVIIVGNAGLIDLNGADAGNLADSMVAGSANKLEIRNTKITTGYKQGVSIMRTGFFKETTSFSSVQHMVQGKLWKGTVADMRGTTVGSTPVDHYLQSMPIHVLTSQGLAP
ncbi:hemagglutinin/hemolysin-related protein [Psychromonas ingrahamii 37]|uniref:Hemagglutinin/hemolysin-related protein n=1 Tax=Psychromonas ingrahamii (strain DSM 17664 / CCUG 51855 / 37) TaxID=357804 RepID=A1SYI9_PSYIN|nr:Ig-like domain-containing protein [Psychromonas ingrahamii]ABM04554.1 hemagglutinin/hemolysin-related protein [Psychromonas ingrahamii 37]